MSDAPKADLKAIATSLVGLQADNLFGSFREIGCSLPDGLRGKRPGHHRPVLRSRYFNFHASSCARRFRALPDDRGNGQIQPPAHRLPCASPRV
ncbi:MAG: hypothetical protein MZV64_19515 [Ignavibacteriales bacterium]|nr:hypothetical protein [Ignavibacteriales bacterium]